MDVPSAGDVRPMPVAARLRRRDVPDQWCGCIEAESLGNRVARHVHDDAGHGQRGGESEAEGEHAHVLQARVGEQTLPGERAPEERDCDCERDEPEADENARCAMPRQRRV